MSLYAHDSESNPVIAYRAEKGITYFCVECSSPVKVRKGSRRQAHFYHLHSYRKCKNQNHLHIQTSVQKALSKQTVILEKQFPTISRIADVVWEEKKIIFEVQCSPMEVKEAKQRILDYRSVGYEVVWILHDQRYNQWKESKLEVFLRDYTFYYANEKGEIYDQFRICTKKVRRYAYLPVSICLMQPIWRTKLYFKGDMYDRRLKSMTLDKKLKGLEKKYLGKSWLRKFWDFMKGKQHR